MRGIESGDPHELEMTGGKERGLGVDDGVETLHCRNRNLQIYTQNMYTGIRYSIIILALERYNVHVYASILWQLRFFTE